MPLAITTVAAFVGAVVLLNYVKTTMPVRPQGVMCTMEAKLCPDGSYVGRSGPNCEFTPCPETASTTTTTPMAVPLPGKVSGSVPIASVFALPGVTVRPLGVASDSRCPASVQCVWAGTVELRTAITVGEKSTETTLTLQKPFTFAGKTVTLEAVTPEARERVTIAPSDYRFIFMVR